MSIVKRNNGNVPTVRTFLSDFFDNNRFFREPFFPGIERELVPAVNVVENEKEYNIEMAAPGYKKENFKVNVENGILNIAAETKEEKEETKKNYTRQEFNYSSFSRSFTLPENANDEKIDAAYENGVLKLTLLKKVPDAPKRKEVTIA